MKRILVALCALLCASAFGTTLNPIQLLNPAGSSSGQAILSTGASTVPVWGNVSAAALTGLVPVANGGTGVNTAAAELARIGAGATASPLSQFAATTSAQLAGVLSDETGTGVVVYNLSPALTSPVLSGTPTAPTAAPGTNTTQIATTAFDTAAVAAALPSGWTTYSPTITALAGTYTTASATGAFSKTGKLVCFWAVAAITTVGTGTNTVLGLPFATASTNGNLTVVPGRENAISGKMLQGVSGSGTSTMTISDYSNANPAVTGASEVMSGCYISS